MAEDINQLLKVRREKLANLIEAGKNPFEITKCDVTHHSMDIKDNYDEMEGKTVTIAVGYVYCCVGKRLSERI